MSTPPTFSGRQLSGRENRAHFNCRNSPIFDPNLQKGNANATSEPCHSAKGRWNRRHNKNQPTGWTRIGVIFHDMRLWAVASSSQLEWLSWGNKITEIHRKWTTWMNNLRAACTRTSRTLPILLHPSCCGEKPHQRVELKTRFSRFNPYPQHRSDMETCRVLSPSTTEHQVGPYNRCNWCYGAAIGWNITPFTHL